MGQVCRAVVILNWRYTLNYCTAAICSTLTEEIMNFSGEWVQSKTGPQRLAQLGYSNVHRLCVGRGLTDYKSDNLSGAHELMGSVK